MRNPRRNTRLLLIAALAAVLCGVTVAGERCDISYINDLGEEVVEIRVKYATPYDEPRFDRSRVNLPPGQEYRIGVQGTTLPELIRVELATKSYVFEDLSGLNPTNSMRLAIARAEGKPLLRRTDGEGEAAGIERDYLTAANRPNAVDKDKVMYASDLGEALEMVRERIGEVREELGEAGKFTVDAGPIWNQDHALARCPEVALEWSAENGREARWNGHWWTTVPGSMSVCECLVGSADESETIFFENDGWGETAIFPVFWMEWQGIGYVVQDREGSAIAMRFPIPADGAGEMLGEVLEDLNIDGFRPVSFVLEAGDVDSDGEAGALLEVETDFRETDGDEDDACRSLIATLADAYGKSLVKGGAAWIETGAFDQAKSGGELPETRGVVCIFGKETFEVIFLPDGSIFM